MRVPRGVSRYYAALAWEVLEAAKANGDEMAANACRRVWRGWMLARPVDRSDITLVAAFAEDALAVLRGQVSASTLAAA